MDTLTPVILISNLSCASNHVAENKRRPELTTIIADSSGMMKADEVAKKSIDGIKKGSFIIPCNLEGVLLSIATAGLSPQRSYLMAFVEVLAAGPVRLIGLCFQWNWYGSIEKWHSKRKSKFALSCLIYIRSMINLDLVGYNKCN